MQEERWLGWLRAYKGPGAYRCKTGMKRDAKFAYNHIVEYRMLLWLPEAAGVVEEVVAAATGRLQMPQRFRGSLPVFDVTVLGRAS